MKAFVVSPRAGDEARPEDKWHGNVHQVTASSWGKPTVTWEFPSQKAVKWGVDLAFVVLFSSCWTNCRVVVDLRRHDAYVAPGYWTSHCWHWRRRNYSILYEVSTLNSLQTDLPCRCVYTQTIMMYDKLSFYGIYILFAINSSRIQIFC